VPYPAGGLTDTIARILADRMQGSLGQSDAQGSCRCQRRR